jgi:hypothetical protein
MNSRKFQASQCEKKAWQVLPTPKNKRMPRPEILEVSIRDFETCVNGMGTDEIEDLLERLTKKIAIENNNSGNIERRELVGHLNQMKEVLTNQLKEYDSFIKNADEYIKSYTGDLNAQDTEQFSDSDYDEDVYGRYLKSPKEREAKNRLKNTSQTAQTNQQGAQRLQRSQSGQQSQSKLSRNPQSKAKLQSQNTSQPKPNFSNFFGLLS